MPACLFVAVGGMSPTTDFHSGTGDFHSGTAERCRANEVAVLWRRWINCSALFCCRQGSLAGWCIFAAQPWRQRACLVSCMDPSDISKHPTAPVALAREKSNARAIVRPVAHCCQPRRTASRRTASRISAPDSRCPTCDAWHARMLADITPRYPRIQTIQNPRIQIIQITLARPSTHHPRRHQPTRITALSHASRSRPHRSHPIPSRRTHPPDSHPTSNNSVPVGFHPPSGHRRVPASLRAWLLPAARAQGRSPPATPSVHACLLCRRVGELLG